MEIQLQECVIFVGKIVENVLNLFLMVLVKLNVQYVLEIYYLMTITIVLPIVLQELTHKLHQLLNVYLVNILVKNVHLQLFVLYVNMVQDIY